MRLALFQPDIPQNAGTLFRTAACLGVPVDLIEPCGFLMDDRRLRRAGLDYLEGLDLTRHASWQRFAAERRRGRLVLLTTRGAADHLGFTFQPDDTLLLGCEGAGVPPAVHAAADATVRIPLKPGLRSLNVAIAGAIVLAEALRQTGGFPA